MTETTQLPMTGSRGQPLKISQYLAEGARLTAAVNAYRQERAGGEPPDEAQAPDKLKRQKLPPLPTPTPIEGYPLNPSRPGEDMPDYETIGRAKRLRRTGRTLPDPIGPPELVKAREASIDPSRIERHDVRTWKVAE
jgi:hypothetical protein